MIPRISTVACIMLVVAGCGGPDPNIGDLNRRSASIPDRPVNRDRLIYETTSSTVYFVQGPYQVAPPGILPGGTRVEVLDTRAETGYVAIRTESGLEAFVAGAKLRSAQPAVVRVKGLPAELKDRDDRDRREDMRFYEDGWF